MAIVNSFVWLWVYGSGNSRGLEDQFRRRLRL
jgi:hypothetical protein